jgi:uncharacterized membrane protein YdjX (TVP38/TMEM64 family)
MHWSKIRRFLAFPLFLVAVLGVAVVFREPLNGLLDSEEALEEALASLGVGAAPALVLLQVFQVVIFIIPGEIVQIAAGFLFGIVPGALLSVTGILIGSAFNFWVGRVLGGPFVRAVASGETLQRIDEMTHRKGTKIGFFLLFLIPGIPKDVLCYVAGSAGKDISFRWFVTFSTIGRVPGILGSAVIGATAARGGILPAVVLLTVAALLLVLGVAHQARLERWLASAWGWIRRDRSRGDRQR